MWFAFLLPSWRWVNNSKRETLISEQGTSGQGAPSKKKVVCQREKKGNGLGPQSPLWKFFLLFDDYMNLSVVFCFVLFWDPIHSIWKFPG